MPQWMNIPKRASRHHSRRGFGPGFCGAALELGSPVPVEGVAVAAAAATAVATCGVCARIAQLWNAKAAANIAASAGFARRAGAMAQSGTFLRADDIDVKLMSSAGLRSSVDSKMRSNVCDFIL